MLKKILRDSCKRNLAISFLYLFLGVYILFSNLFGYKVLFDWVFFIICFVHMIDTKYLLSERKKQQEDTLNLLRRIKKLEQGATVNEN